MKRSTTSGGSYTPIATGVTATNFADTGLVSGFSYYYVVSAVIGASESLNSMEAVVLPPWQWQDIGSTGLAGGTTYGNGVFALAGSGADIWSTADAFRFAYVTATGNCTIIARVAAVQNIDGWSKAGVMIRSNLTANAANAFVAVTPGNGVTWQTRSSIGGTTGNNATTGLSAPYWVKLVRSGNNFTGYRSANGVTWTQQGAATTITMGTTVYVGVALTSHNNSSLCAATFDNVSVPGWTTAPPPTIPTGLTAVAVSSFQINAQWSATSNAASYNLKRSTTNGDPYTTIATGVASTNYSDSGISAGTTYYYVVSAVNSAGESTNSLPASATTLPLELGAFAHRYSFGENGGTSVADSIGGPDWAGTLTGGGTLADGQLTLTSASSQYVSLPAGIVVTFCNFTIEAWVKLNSTTNWSRIFDFGNSTTANMFLTPQNGGNGRLRFTITTNGGGGEQQIDGTSALAAGVWQHVAVTLKGASGVLYVNGVAVGTNNAMTLNPSALGSTVNNYIGKSQYPDPYFNGLMDEFRIYGVALLSSEIAATYALGPTQVLSTNSPQISMAIAGTSLTMSWPLASAGYTLQSRTNLGLGIWVNVASPVPQIIGSQWQVTLPLSGSTSLTFYRLLK